MPVRAFGLVAVLVALNVAAWALALAVFWSHPVLLGTALLAFTFGLRHAVDADHICAIDNVTRKLVQEDRRPIGVGFFFSLGHSTVVIALSLAIAVSAAIVKDHLPSLERLGALVGTSVSAFFLLLVAAINLVVLLEIFGALTRARRGETLCDDALDDTFDRRGLFGRIFRPLLRIVDRSWKMYPVGLLFGLGFDTATEVALLGIAAVEAGKGLPVFAILIFPLLFTAGMALIDTADGIVMVGAYGWALIKPMRKLYYNFVVTLLSVLVAVIVGSVEATNVVADQLQLSGSFWDAIRAVNENFGVLGFVIVGLFVGSWLVSMGVYRLLRLERA
jgi:nickel/cobalt transporter (NiCoT) family protein